eukprot:TRINITY_DN28540_c0_g1_i1.p1 TRINITY_DN28540_c0_g1~~TRINITY_DN28540_c0_g1_i1.p1  ORF type:complete len:193 (-),score=48.56 TRINITY_DN28540_c0_g1_i1:401-979(-)
MEDLQWEEEREIAAAKFLDEMKKHPMYGIVQETEDHVFFWKPRSAFDQWTPCKFEVDGILYNCAEQYMMAEKARLFGDERTRQAILKEFHPLKQKNLASAKGTLTGFDQAVWDQECYGIVLKGNMAKYSQNLDLQDALLMTGEKQLVEASPQDSIWGIGLGMADAQATSSAKWPGKNLLGKVLMDVRTQLRA